MGLDNSSTIQRWVWVIIFAVAFAWVESAVVIYLREIYFSGEFQFPLLIVREGGRRIIDPLVKIEFGREIATIIMLFITGCLAGKRRLTRFWFFMIAFGVWDIFYYVWLKVLSDWPESLMTWDLLFYVPLPWVGPVITPVLIALAMVILGSAIIFLDEKGLDFRFRWYDIVIEAGCGVLLVAAFCWDWKNILQIQGEIEHTGIPTYFAWWLYLPTYIFAVAYLTLRIWQFRKIHR